MSLVIKFYFTSSMLNMFRTLIHPSSGAWDFSIVSPHWSCVLVSMCVGVSVWLGLGGIRVAGWSTNAQVCLDRISLSFWYLSCDKKLTHRTFVRAIQNHVSSILAKSLIISFQYNIETVYFFYSNPVYMHLYIYIYTYIQGVSKRALQLWKRIEIYTEDIHNVLNCQNVAKHTEFYLG